MATNHTTNYHLNTWEPGDSFLRSEFNENFNKLDAALKAVEDQIPVVITGTYTGTGGTSGVRKITLPGRPKVVVIRTEYPNTYHHYKAVVIMENTVIRIHTYNTPEIEPPDKGYALQDDGFTVPSNSDQNYSGAPQYYMAIV